jgi:hypothetical protein
MPGSVQKEIIPRTLRLDNLVRHVTNLSNKRPMARRRPANHFVALGLEVSLCLGGYQRYSVNVSVTWTRGPDKRPDRCFEKHIRISYRPFIALWISFPRNSGPPM